MMTRPSYDEWAMMIARVVALRATCFRRLVGAVLVDIDGHILSTGYNGRHAGARHCNEVQLVPDEGQLQYREARPFLCEGARLPSGTGLDLCEAIHAEQNALLQCRSVNDIHACYVTVSPCMTCVKLLLNTSCKRIVFDVPYAHDQAKNLWESQGLEWVQQQKEAT